MKTTELWHLRFSSAGRLPAFAEEKVLRECVLRLGRVVGDRLIVFGMVEEHGHVVVLETSQRVGLLARSIKVAIRAATGATLEAGWRERVESRSHLTALVRYALRQPERHDLAVHPALWTGTSFLDLVGARWVGGLRPTRLSSVMPRLRQRQLCQMVNLDVGRILLAENDMVRALGAARLVEAAGAAMALPASDQRSALAVLTRRTIARVGAEAAIGSAELAWALGVTRRTANRLVSSEAHPELMQTVWRRLWLEELARRLSSRQGKVA